MTTRRDFLKGVGAVAGAGAVAATLPIPMAPMAEEQVKRVLAASIEDIGNGWLRLAVTQPNMNTVEIDGDVFLPSGGHLIQSQDLYSFTCFAKRRPDGGSFTSINGTTFNLDTKEVVDKDLMSFDELKKYVGYKETSPYVDVMLPHRKLEV